MLTTGVGLGHWIRRIHKTKVASLVICLSAFAAFAQTPANFTYAIGGNLPAAQQWSITTQFAPNTLKLSTSGQPWISASLSSTITPATLTISVNPANLTAGTYTGTVDVTSTNILRFAVSLTVTPVTASLTFTAAQNGTSPAPQSLVIGSSSPGAMVLVDDATPLPNWLTLGGFFGLGTAPVTIPFTVNQSGLAPGTYTAYVGFQSCAGICFGTLSDSWTVKVTLNVTAPPVTSSSTSLQFNAIQGGISPVVQTLVVGSSTPGVAITTSTSLPGWLSLNNWRSGTTPATIPVAVNLSGLLPGTYSSAVTFSTVNNGVVTVNITLVVTAPGLTVNTSQLLFQYLTGSATPPPQPIQITSSGTQLSASVSLTVPWLTATTLSGTTPLTVSVGVNPTGMAVGTYSGQVVVANASSPTQTVNVSLTIAPDLRPVITSVVNGASFKSGVGRGAWISIMGSNFASKTSGLSAPFLTSLNGVTAQLSGVGGAYTLLMYYLSPTQINAFVPLEVAQSLLDNPCSVAVITPNGSNSFTTQCQSLTPALFNYGTQHYASATHIDGTIVGVVSGTLPAQSGSIITLWGTGFGQTAPPTSTSSINYSGISGILASPVVVLVNNIPATVLYAGMVGVGLYQFNIQLPDGLAGGDYAVTVQISGVTSDQVMLPVR